MGLRAQLAQRAPTVYPRGFQLPDPPLQHYRDGEAFKRALVRQRNALALVDATPALTDLDLDGRVGRTDYRLTGAAFGDLCHLSRPGTTGLPSRWCQQIAARNEALALAVIRDHIDAHLGGNDKRLVVDTESGLVLGIVGERSYHLMHHADIFDLGCSAEAGALTFTNGWVFGGRMRYTCVREADVIEPQPGDIVRTGLSCESAVNGDSRVHVMEYGEVLRCTNGMVRRTGTHTQSISHADADIHDRVPAALVAAATRSAAMRGLIDTAAALHLDVTGHARVGTYLATGQTGGNATLAAGATKRAVEYAVQSGRESDDLTLWDYVQGTTEMAHTMPSLSRRVEVEELGYRLLEHFASAGGRQLAEKN